MFELTISINLENQAYISKLYKNLAEEVKMASGVIAKENYNGRSCLSFAVKKESKEYFISKILDFVSFVVIDCYKYNYFKEKLMPTNETVVFESFLKAVTIFDLDLDKEYIANKIDFGGKILIDSLYYFNLQDLSKRWQKTVDIINFNQIVKNNSSMLEILKYLTTVSDNLVKSADVVISKKQLKIKHLEKSKQFKRNFVGLSKFLSEIIELNPAKINLKLCESGGEEVVEMLSKIFYDKINF